MSNFAMRIIPISRNNHLSGPYKIRGQVTELKINPLARRVRLYERATGYYIAETMSDSDGWYEFKYLTNNIKYCAYSIDHTNAYNLAGADNLPMEAM